MKIFSLLLVLVTLVLAGCQRTDETNSGAMSSNDTNHWNSSNTNGSNLNTNQP